MLLTFLITLLPLAFGQTNTTTTPRPSTCKPGTNLGTFVLKSPVMSDKLFVGDIFTVKWEYSPPSRNIPKAISLKVRQVNANTKPWKDPETIVLNATLGDKKEVDWEVPPSVTGEYEMRLVPDGKDNSDVENLPCYANGDVVPAQSAKFFIANVKDLFVTKDEYPPNSGGLRSSGSLILMGVVFGWLLFV